MSGLIFDEIRKKWIKATPEEKVRQKWLHHFVHSLGFPKELIAVEKDLKDLPQLVAKEVPDRRVDILCYGRRVDSSFFPLLLVECKEKGGTFAKEQVIGYNAFVQAPFVA